MAYAFSVQYFENATIVAYAGFTLKPASFYYIEKHVNCTLILKVNLICCVQITDCGLIAYQRIQALFTHETKAYKIGFLLM